MAHKHTHTYTQIEKHENGKSFYYKEYLMQNWFKEEQNINELLKYYLRKKLKIILLNSWLDKTKTKQKENGR